MRFFLPDPLVLGIYSLLPSLLGYKRFFPVAVGSAHFLWVLNLCCACGRRHVTVLGTGQSVPSLEKSSAISVWRRSWLSDSIRVCAG